MSPSEPSPEVKALSAKLEGEVVVMRDALTRLSLAMQDYVFELEMTRKARAANALQKLPGDLTDSP